MADVEVVDQRTYPVRSLSGEVLSLQTEAEQTFYVEAQSRYMSEFAFTAASDRRAVDRLVFFETMALRLQSQLASGRDYDGMFLDDRDIESLRKSLKETAPLILGIQEDLGLTKAQRDRDQMESVGAYITQLQQAAKQHGVRREKQLGKAIELCKELFSLAGTYRRSDENEREKLGLTSAEDIVTWVLEFMKPEFDKVDEHFRANQQRFWVRTL